MVDERALWEQACVDAGLSPAEAESVRGACAREPELEGELTFLVAHLSADLSGQFLRAFVDRLGGEDVAGGSVLPALRDAIAATPRPTGRRPGAADA